MNDKINICFTWDDNFHRHTRLIAPLFEKYGYLCTFYPISGEENFERDFADEYMSLTKKGFEIGSHGFTHVNFLKLSEEEQRENMEKSVSATERYLSLKPQTFAFPYHLYDDRSLEIAREYFIETRNTLFNSRRFDIKTDCVAADFIKAVDEAIRDGKNLVFAGHAAVDEPDSFPEDPVYEPVKIKVLDEALYALARYSEKADVVTLKRACEWRGKNG